MRHVAPVRKQLGIRTIFNILGPLANPAGAEYQLLGVGRGELRPLVAKALQRLGTQKTLVVHGADGMGDVTCGGTTYVTEVTPGSVCESTWTPEDFGREVCPTESLAIETPGESATLIGKILAGELGAPREVVILNAAASLLAAGAASDPATAAEKAVEAIDTGAARELLRKLGQRSHAPA